MRRRSPAPSTTPADRWVAHGRLVFCAVAGALVGALWPGDGTAMTRLLIGWNAFVWPYLATVAITLVRADSGHIKRLALARAESAALVLAIVVVAALASLAIVVVELIAAKAAGPHHMFAHLAFAFASVVGTWLLLPMLFGLSYASEYYSPDPDRGLSFPEAAEGFEPDHTDFLYFSFTIAVTAQTSDVGVTTRAMRRLVLFQSLLSFLFNTTILAFSINAAASFF